MRDENKSSAAALQEQLQTFISCSYTPDDQLLESLCIMFQLSVRHEDFVHLDPEFRDILVDSYDSLRKLVKCIFEHRNAVPNLAEVLGIDDKQR